MTKNFVGNNLRIFDGSKKAPLEYVKSSHVIPMQFLLGLINSLVKSSKPTQIYRFEERAHMSIFNIL